MPGLPFLAAKEKEIGAQLPASAVLTEAVDRASGQNKVPGGVPLCRRRALGHQRERDAPERLWGRRGHLWGEDVDRLGRFLGSSILFCNGECNSPFVLKDTSKFFDPWDSWGVFILNITPQREAGIGRPSSIWVMLHMGYALPTPSLWVVPGPWLWVLCFMHWTGTGPCSFAQSCLTLCDSMDCSPQGSSVRGFFQTRMLKWVAISFFGDLPDPGI